MWVRPLSPPAPTTKTAPASTSTTGPSPIGTSHTNVGARPFDIVLVPHTRHQAAVGGPLEQQRLTRRT
ncbi:MAG: hypothetical protein M3O70_00060 [Actinomycetota bacterium]|nr:hypothetical protein [Actinomycetota bacterium]